MVLWSGPWRLTSGYSILMAKTISLQDWEVGWLPPGCCNGLHLSAGQREASGMYLPFCPGSLLHSPADFCHCSRCCFHLCQLNSCCFLKIYLIIHLSSFPSLLQFLFWVEIIFCVFYFALQCCWRNQVSPESWNMFLIFVLHPWHNLWHIHCIEGPRNPSCASKHLFSSFHLTPTTQSSFWLQFRSLLLIYRL